MDPMTQLFIGLLLTGLLLIGVEIYLPGGVVGVLGAMALTGAGVVGFRAFGFQGGKGMRQQFAANALPASHRIDRHVVDEAAASVVPAQDDPNDLALRFGDEAGGGVVL